jgi:hypothetical protein
MEMHCDAAAAAAAAHMKRSQKTDLRYLFHGKGRFFSVAESGRLKFKSGNPTVGVCGGSNVARERSFVIRNV